MSRRTPALLILGLFTVGCHDGPTDPVPPPQFSVTGWTELNVTNHPANQARPTVAGGRVVWWDPRTPAGLYWWDGTDVSLLRWHNFYQWDPVGSRRWVVFYEHRAELQPDGTFKWYGSLQSLDLDASDPASTVRPITSNAPTAYYQRYDISGDLFAYQDHTYADPQGIYVYDLTAGSQTHFFELLHSPRISIDRMIAAGSEGNPYGCVGVCLVDLTTNAVTRLPISVIVSPWSYDLDGERVVFQDHPSYTLWVLDLSTGVQSQLTEERGAGLIRISGDYVVWVQVLEGGAGGYDVRLHDLTTGDEFTLGHSDTYSIQGLDISGTRIAWGAHTGTDYDIFVADLATGIVPSVEGVKEAIDEYLADGSIANAGVADALIASLDQVTAAIGRGDTTAARNKLDAIISFITAQSGKHIASDVAEALIDAVQTIIEEDLSG